VHMGQVKHDMEQVLGYKELDDTAQGQDGKVLHGELVRGGEQGGHILLSRDKGLF